MNSLRRHKMVRSDVENRQENSLTTKELNPGTNALGEHTLEPIPKDMQEEPYRGKVFSELHARFLEARECAYRSRSEHKRLREEYETKLSLVTPLPDLSKQTNVMKERLHSLTEALSKLVEETRKESFMSMTQSDRAALVHEQLRKQSGWNVHIESLLGFVSILQSDPIKLLNTDSCQPHVVLSPPRHWRP